MDRVEIESDRGDVIPGQTGELAAKAPTPAHPRPARRRWKGRRPRRGSGLMFPIGSKLLRSDPIPFEMLGKWIAWSPDGLHIVGSGDTPAEARAQGGGDPDLILQGVPTSDQIRYGYH